MTGLFAVVTRESPRGHGTGATRFSRYEYERMNGMSVPGQVLELVETFGRNVDAYRSGMYNETNLRQEFLNPFFGALGWDVNNARGYAQAYKDVIHEDSIKVGSATKAPDYCFRIGGARKFFVEAKKPVIDIKHDIHPAYQLRRYAWSAKLPLSILTDFEEFAVYDCRVRPVSSDKASVARVKYIKYDEYAERWDEIAEVFGREAILKGSFDKYAASSNRKKGTAEVDAAFLAEIEIWRDGLAHNLAMRNAELSNRQLNFAVQRTIDRIIFLRICEDRGIEPYGQLQSLLNGVEVYKRLLTVFDRADERYNSGLFYFHKERERTDAPDELTPSLEIDDRQLKDIIRKLYYPESPYEFSVLGADILGQVYEQFLGKVITLTKGHRAKVEDKPEVKKAGGVYYTPTYIVDYIVKNTVGQLVWGYAAETDGTCLVCKGLWVGGQGSGVGGQGNELGERNENRDQIVQGSSCVARGDGTGGPDVQGSQKAAAKRKVRNGSADDTSGSIRTCQHCGRSWFEPSEGVSQPFVDFERVTDGVGYLHTPDGKTRISGSATNSRCAKAKSDGRQATERTDSVSERRALTPKQVGELRVLDPACGSGSFLIGAYQYLLDWHLKYYAANEPEKWARQRNPRIYQDSTGGWKLTTGERKRILLNNIYGVDIDSQAVEVTKLSLLLKVLEGESQASLDNQLRLFHERALPDLSDNIKCGNSLIGPDFYEGRQMELFDDEEMYRINAFDWEAEFGEIFKGKNPGFDAVIGNPPYIDSEWMTKYLPGIRDYCVANYKSASGNWDIFCVFIERALKLCKENGYSSFIVPNKLGGASYAAATRSILTVNNVILIIRDYSKVSVFPVAIYPIVYVARKTLPNKSSIVRYEKMGLTKDDQFKCLESSDLDYVKYFSEPQYPWQIFSNINDANPSGRIRKAFPPLGSLAKVLGAATVSEAYKIKPIIKERDGNKYNLKVINSGAIDRYHPLWGEKKFRYMRC